MTKVRANGLELEVIEEGPAEGPPLVHISGIFSQLVRWDASYFAAMAARGLRVIRYDNRDVGLSEKLDHLGQPDVMDLMAKLAAGEKVEAPYTLHDMADDCIGVLDALGVESAHIEGESMGGMIGQIVAAKYPERVRSLISAMSTSSRPHLPPASPEAQAVLFTRAKNPDDREEVLRNSTNSKMIIAGPKFNPGETYQRAKAEEHYQRAYFPETGARHMAAALASQDRLALLGAIKVPTLVLHGRDDPLVPLAHGEDTAALIEGAELIVVDGMGHAVEPDLSPALAEHIGGFIERVEE